MVPLLTLAVVVIAAAGYFAYTHFTGSADETAFEQEKAQAVQAATQERQAAEAAADEAIRARVDEWNALMDSVVATGEDKTKEIAAYLEGDPSTVHATAVSYQEQWSAMSTPGAAAAVVAGSSAVSRIVLGPREDTAGVVITQTLRLADGSTARCAENTVWSLAGGVWSRSCTLHAYWHAQGGIRPFELGVQVEGVVWDLVKVVAQTEKGQSLVVAYVVARNQTAERKTLSAYSLSLMTADGGLYEVSTITDTLFPTFKEDVASPLLSDEEKWLTLAFEMPADTELTALQYEVEVAATSEPATSEPAAPGGVAGTGVDRAEPGSPEAWALATSAVLMDPSGSGDELLGGVFADARNVEKAKRSLEEWWGVFNRNDLLEVLEWLKAEGHRTPWDETAAYIATLSDAELEHLKAEIADDTNLAHGVEVVERYAAQLGSKSILGFDLCRYVMLCRRGYLCGYLSEEEAWKRIMPAAAKLQATFSSWQELGENYLIGREFWSYKQTLIDGDDMRLWIKSLTTTPGSPWKSNPWNTDLGTAALGTM